MNGQDELLPDTRKPPDLVAVKIPRPDTDLNRPRSRKPWSSMAMESQILRNAFIHSHPNIVQVLGVCWKSVKDGALMPSFVMEAAEMDLEKYLTDPKSVDYRKILRLAVDIVTGVRALHEVGIIHGDIKPANVLIFRDPQLTYVAKIADFGSSLLRSDLKAPQAPECREPMRDEARISEKLQWALKEGEITKTLGLLESMIDDLCKFFKPPENGPVALQVANSLLSSLSIAKLNAVAVGAPDDSMFQSLALLKVMILQLQLGVSNADRVDEKDRLLRETGVLDERTRRSTGTFRKGSTTSNVLVEWKLIDNSYTHPGHSTSTYRAMAEYRIKNLARLLKRSSKLEYLRTLDCIGVVSRDGLSDDEVRYGIIFRMPSKRYTTLKAILEGPQDGIFLDDWFKVARSVTRAVLCLHLAGWLHKGLRSENILYFIEDDGIISYEKPYIAGFEYSREISAPGQTEGVTDDLEANLYRHVEVQGLPEEAENGEEGNSTQDKGRTSFAMKHDIYSVGVLLLELGLQKPAIQLYEAATKGEGYEHSATAF